MKLNTVMPYNQKAIKVSFTTAQDGPTGEIIREFYDDGDIDIRFVAKSRNQATVYTTSDLALFSRLRLIRDRAGAVVGDTYAIQAKSPVLNVLGFADGWSYDVALWTGD